uniref:Zinc finger CCCH domain-containing protein 65 n=1 Tax=Solanum tuberosum TaxID=4113 RepID=M1B5U8_SOLTU
MENSQIGALKPLQNLYPLPPRRRLLMSQTYSTLLQIISDCPSTDSTTDKQKLDDNESSKLGTENEVGESVDHRLIRSENLLGTGPAHNESNNLAVQSGSGDRSDGNSRYGYGDFTRARMQVDLDLSNHTSNAVEGDRGDFITNDIIDMNCLVHKTLGYNYQMVKEPGNRCSTHESEVKEPDPIRPVGLDKDSSIDDVSAGIESCFGADAIADLSQPAELSGEKMDDSETHFSEEMKHGLRVKEVELETLISSAGAAESSVHVPMGEEMEEGEAFRDFMVFDESDYDILNHIGNEKKDGADESPADISGREEFAFDVHVNAPQRKDASASSTNDAVDEDNTFVGGEFIRKFREEPQDNTEKVFRSKDVETRKVCVYDTILDSENNAKQVGGDVKLDHPAGSQFDSTSGVNAKKRKHLKVATENENIGKNEKKRGPLTKESKARKKAKRRSKRAEERIKLGVKRLRLPPVVKPKVVKYCRHYLKGRCLEGEACKFSHDTIPLTKSKITVKTEAVTSPIASNSLVQVNTNGMLHKDVNSTSSSAGLVPRNSTERTVLEHVRKPAASTPKGITFLSHGKSLQGDARKHEEVGLPSKANGVDNIQKPNGFMKGASTRTPQGMNFLSFGRAPSAEPSGDTLSGVLNMDYGVDKLQLVDMKAKLGSINQMSTRTPPGSVPRGVNFLSVDKAVEDRPHPNECYSASSPIQRRQSAPNTTSSEMPFRQLSSLFPAGQSLIQSAQKCNAEIASSPKAPFLANTPSSIQKALQSTLAFAAKFDLGVKCGMSNGSRH